MEHAEIPIQPEHLSDHRLAAALALLEPATCGRNVPYEQLQDTCELARAQIDRLFRQHLHTSPKNILEQRCLAAAQEQLRHSDNAIKSIAAQFGFSDPAISRAGFSATGTHPAIWRRLHTA